MQSGDCLKCNLGTPSPNVCWQYSFLLAFSFICIDTQINKRLLWYVIIARQVAKWIVNNDRRTEEEVLFWISVICYPDVRRRHQKPEHIGRCPGLGLCQTLPTQDPGPPRIGIWLNPAPPLSLSKSVNKCCVTRYAHLFGFFLLFPILVTRKSLVRLFWMHFKTDFQKGRMRWAWSMTFVLRELMLSGISIRKPLLLVSKYVGTWLLLSLKAKPVNVCAVKLKKKTLKIGEMRMAKIRRCVWRCCADHIIETAWRKLIDMQTDRTCHFWH